MSLLLSVCKDNRRYKRRYRNREYNADAACDTAYDLDGHIRRAVKLMHLKTEGVEVDDERKAAADEGKNKRIRHGSDHISAYVHAGAEQLFFAECRIDGVDLRKCGGDAHCNVHNCAERTDDDAADEEMPDSDKRTALPELQKRFGFV